MQRLMGTDEGTLMATLLETLGGWNAFALVLSVAVAIYLGAASQRNFRKLVYVPLGYCVAIGVLYWMSAIVPTDVPGYPSVPEPYSTFGVGIVAFATYLKFLRTGVRGNIALVILSLGCFTSAALTLAHLTIVSMIAWYGAAFAFVVTIVGPAIARLINRSKY